MTEEKEITGDAPFWVGEWRVEPTTGRISRQGEEVRLEPKVMTVLVCLARRAGAVLTREELEATAWAGMVVGYDSLASSIIKLRKALGDDSKHPTFVETVPKKGYRLIATVGPVAHDAPAASAAPQAASRPPASPGARPVAKYLLPALAGVAVLGVLLAWLLARAPAPEPRGGDLASADKPSIAVLPFENLSNDPQQDYFSDGITADLITDLSKVSGLSVIARNSVFTYKDTRIDVRTVGRELGVGYVLEGSVRKVADKVRISARLIDTRSGVNLWAERFDGALHDVFALQDEVTGRIVSLLKVRLTDNERLRLSSKYSASIEAYEYFLQGWKSFWEFSKQSNRAAQEFYLKAIELDPGFARAYANLAMAHAYDYYNGWSDDPRESLAQAHSFAAKAIAINPAIPQVHWAMGLTYTFDKQYQEALRSVEKSIEVDPNFADGYGLLSTILNYAGKPAQAVAVMEKAMRLNPRHPFVYKSIYAEILFNLHEYDRAIENFNVALERNPEAQTPRLWLAAAYAHAGRTDDAEWELEQIRAAGADLSLPHIEEFIPLSDPVQRKHLIDGLQKAGLGR